MVYKLYEQADTWLLRLGIDSATEHKRPGHQSFDCLPLNNYKGPCSTCICVL